ncbi:hypothetical protein ACFL1X_14485, partial [Candidatus Hydrogenedentota bacterium]
QELSPPQARGEAIAIIEQGYRNTHSRGYDAAILDASDKNKNGTGIVLLSLTEIIITRERDKYRHWIFTTRIDSLDWRMKRQIAAILKKRWEPLLSLSPRAASLTPEQIALCLREFIRNHLDTERIIHKKFAGGAVFRAY